MDINQQVCSAKTTSLLLACFFARKFTVIAIECFAATILWFALNNATKHRREWQREEDEQQIYYQERTGLFVFRLYVRFSSADSFYLFLFVSYFSCKNNIAAGVVCSQRSFFKETRWFAANKILLSTFRRVKNMLLVFSFFFCCSVLNEWRELCTGISLALTTGRWIQTTLTQTCTRAVIAFTLDAMTTKFYLWQNIYYL